MGISFDGEKMYVSNNSFQVVSLTILPSTMTLGERCSWDFSCLQLRPSHIMYTQHKNTYIYIYIYKHILYITCV